MTIGLTGGIGCGKSSVLPVFEKIGFAIVDSDRIAAEIYSDSESRRFVRERFGSDAVTADGNIDKAAIARVVFSDKAALADLEAFMHPRIREEWQRRIRDASPKNVVVEVPLLFEKNYEKDFDVTVCVAASPEIQLARLEQRGLPEDQARARIAAQMPLAEKIRRADIVIFNDGSRDFLEKQIREKFC